MKTRLQFIRPRSLPYCVGMVATLVIGAAGQEVPQPAGKPTIVNGRAIEPAKAPNHSIQKLAPINHYNLSEGRLALQGYDPVAYLKGRSAVKGNAAIVSTHDGVLYYFASSENKEAFDRDPGKFLPAYGGWCATAMAKGKKVEIDPTNFKVTNGRLFLFFKAFYADASKDWNKDEVNLTAKADAQWRRIIGE